MREIDGWLKINMLEKNVCSPEKYFWPCSKEMASLFIDEKLLAP